MKIIDFYSNRPTNNNQQTSEGKERGSEGQENPILIEITIKYDKNLNKIISLIFIILGFPSTKDTNNINLRFLRRKSLYGNDFIEM